MKHNILLIDDDLGILKATKAFLESEGFFVKAVSNPDEGIALVRQNTIPFSLALIDYHMPDLKGDEVIRRIRQYNTEVTLLAFSGDDSINVHNQALDSGAIFFVSKDTPDAKLLGIIHRICTEVERKTKPLAIVNENENKAIINNVGMIGVSNHMAQVANLILKYAPSSETVLIRGENGTGKERVARALHEHSQRRQSPFVAVNCAAIPTDIIESELFGHEKGSFTGAVANKVGKFQAANGGTLFLDEIGEMPLHLQATLLRVLQEKTITPVGSNTAKPVNVRVVAATNAPLEKMIEDGLFRMDLYYRLSVLPILVWPLRKRVEDIPCLAERFLIEANEQSGHQRILLQSTVDEFMRYPWPGNVRELQHMITYMVTVSEQTILISDLLNSRNSLAGSMKIEHRDLESLRFKTRGDEKRLISETLIKSKSISEAARKLNISRSTLRDKMKTLGIKIHKQVDLEAI